MTESVSDSSATLAYEGLRTSGWGRRPSPGSAAPPPPSAELGVVAASSEWSAALNEWAGEPPMLSPSENSIVIFKQAWVAWRAPPLSQRGAQLLEESA